jgi:hypothetical protein
MVCNRGYGINHLLLLSYDVVITYDAGCIHREMLPWSLVPSIPPSQLLRLRRAREGIEARLLKEKSSIATTQL